MQKHLWNFYRGIQYADSIGLHSELILTQRRNERESLHQSTTASHTVLSWESDMAGLLILQGQIPGLLSPRAGDSRRLSGLSASGGNLLYSQFLKY